MALFSLLLTSLYVFNEASSYATYGRPYGGVGPSYEPGYGQSIHRVTQVMSPGYVGTSQSQQHSQHGYGSSGHGGQSGYGGGSNNWNRGSSGGQNTGGVTNWNQGESTSWGKEYGHSNRHNVGNQASYGQSGYGSHSVGHGQSGYGHGSGYGFNQGGYGNQGGYHHQVRPVGGFVGPVAPIGPPVGPVATDYDVWRSGGENKGQGHETEITRIKVYNFTKTANDEKNENSAVAPQPTVVTELPVVVIEPAKDEVVNVDRARDQVN